MGHAYVAAHFMLEFGALKELQVSTAATWLVKENADQVQDSKIRCTECGNVVVSVHQVLSGEHDALPDLTDSALSGLCLLS